MKSVRSIRPEFPESDGQAVLTRVAAEFAQDQGGGHRALLDGGRQPQDFVPMRADHLDLAPVLRTGGCATTEHNRHEQHPKQVWQEI